MPILLDAASIPAYVTGANEPDRHLRGVQPGSRLRFETSTSAGRRDTVDGQAIRIEPAIEIGNIFKLGTRYSEPLGATFWTSAARAAIWMGSYGIGPPGTAAAVEQFADEQGISWPRSLAPFDVELGLGKAARRAPRRPPVRRAARPG